MPDDSLLDDNPVSGDDIADAAKSQLGTSAYQLYSYNDGVPAGEPKDHLFVSHVLGNVGLGFDGCIDKHPSADDWADPNSNIPGWSPVSGPPQAGDVLAASKPVRNDWYFGGGQQLGIATGNNTSIGINNSTHIGENDFGFQPSHDPTIWRSDQVANAGSPVSEMGADNAPDQPTGKPWDNWTDDEWKRNGKITGGIIGGTVGCIAGSESGCLPSAIVGVKRGAKVGGWIGAHHKEIGEVMDKIGDQLKNRPDPQPGEPGSPGTPGDTD